MFGSIWWGSDVYTWASYPRCSVCSLVSFHGNRFLVPFPLSLSWDQCKAYTQRRLHIWVMGEKIDVLFYKVRNMIKPEKLPCKIPWVEEFRFPDSLVLTCGTLVTPSAGFPDRAAHGTCTHTCLCWLEGDWHWVIEVLKPLPRYFTGW